MATVTQICDRVCAVTGLANTGTDRAQVVEYVNQAYSNAVLEAGGFVGSFSKSLSDGVADYDIGTAPLDVTDISEIRNLWITDSAVNMLRVMRIPEHELVALRQGTIPSATPLYYALRGTQTLLLHPAPNSGTVLAGSYLKAAPTLTEGAPVTGEEDTPSAFPAAFHFDVIANKAIALAMEFDNRFEEGAAYDAKYAAAMDRLLVWTARFGGSTIDTSAYLGYEGPRDSA